jgi:hypothetical protein
VIDWQLRSDPLTPTAVVGQAGVARALGRAILRRDDDALARLTAVAGDQVLLVLGEEAMLPWVDGVLYLGRDPEAPSLLLSTLRRPSCSLALFERAVVRKLRTEGVVALVDSLIVPASSARPIDRGTLEKWLAREGS